MQIVRHVNNVVNDYRNPVDRKSFKIPVRGRCGDGYRDARFQFFLQDRKELEIVQAIAWSANRSAID